MSEQIHKRLTDEQMRMIMKRYLARELSTADAIDLLGLKRRQFFEWVQKYRDDPDGFTIAYRRKAGTRKLDEKVHGHILQELAIEKALIDDPSVPIRFYNYSYIQVGRISDTRRCWCPKPTRPLCHSMVTQEYTYAYGAVSVTDGEFDSLILPHVNGEWMRVFLNEVASRHPNDRIVMILDGAGWYASGAVTIPANMRLVPLPPYAPELNPMEHIWNDLREKSFHNVYSKAWTHSKTIWKYRYGKWSAIGIGYALLSRGPG